MKVSELINCDFLKPIVISQPEKEIAGVYIGDLLSWVMGRAEAGNIWITIMSNINVLAVASLADVSSIIIAENVELSDEIITVAKEKGINIFASEESAYEIAVRLNGLL